MLSRLEIRGSQGSDKEPTPPSLSPKGVTEETQSYGDRKKFWEQMSTSTEKSIEEQVTKKTIEEHVTKKTIEETITKKSVQEPEIKKTIEESVTRKSNDDAGLVKTLTDKYSEKIAAGELVMPALPRPLSRPKLTEEPEIVIRQSSTDRAVLSELEARLQEKKISEPASGVTETAELTSKVTRGESIDSEADFLEKYGEEVVAFENSGFVDEDEEIQEETFQKRPPPVIPIRKSIYERSMSLPPEDMADSGIRSHKRHFEAQMKKEIIVEQLMTQLEEEHPSPEHKSIADLHKQDSISSAKIDLSPEEKLIIEVEEVAKQTIKELILESEDIADIRRKTKLEIEPKADEVQQFTRTSDSLEVHVDKSEIESSEKEADEVLKTLDETPKLETTSVGESEDTQSESDVTPEEARLAEGGAWEIPVISSDSPKDEIELHIRADGQRIGRWVGQENLAQVPSEPDEFLVETRWERTRSESTSPKVYTPEEHYPDTVWEVPVQEQCNTEEVTQDIPIEKQTIMEKDEEYDEEMEDAKRMAEDVVDYIEQEVEKRSSLIGNSTMEDTVSTYIRQLAGEKDLDEREVELIESVLAKKQREEIMKIHRTDTTGSSMEITDEDLRSSGMDTDGSPAESQSDKAPIRKISKHLEKTTEDVIEETLAEVKESLDAAKEELIQEHKKNKRDIKESPSEFEFKSLSKTIIEEKLVTHAEEITVVVAEPTKTARRGSSEESPDDGIKSPPVSSSSSGGRQANIVLRHSSSSSKSSRKTGDRLSAIEAEPYSSSGESHYQSFEQTSSRPCSSDIEALLASGTTGSSEYESAISQRITTSGEYVTAKSSLSSRESIKSLDSESSGHLGSIEISSDASETLIASAVELDRDEGYGVILLDDDSPEMLDKPSRPTYMTQHSAPATAHRPSIEEDFEPVSDIEAASEDDEPVLESLELKMKRSQEMTFQPVPKTIVSTESIESSPGDILAEKYMYGSSVEETTSLPDERLASSYDETGSVLSMSLSTASEASAVRTIISRTESEKLDSSMTISGASGDSGSREELDSFFVPPTSEIGTATSAGQVDVKTRTVTITTSSIDDSGTSCVSTQVTSLSRKSSEADDGSQSTEESSETITKKQGHRRKESTSSFVPSMLWTVGETKPSKIRIEVDDVEERAESDQFSIILTDKEVKCDEKKESDESESYQTEADQAIKSQQFIPERGEFPDEEKSRVSPVGEERSETQSQSDLLKHDEFGTSPSSPGEIPDITVTQHLAPLIDRDFHYPDLELEEQELKKTDEGTPQTPASMSSRASSTTSTDQGKEYVVNEESDVCTTVQTVCGPLKEEDELSSPNSDSFELLDKPDLSEEYVIIEEVGKEASENDREGKSVQIGTKQRRVVKKKDDEELLESPPAPETKMTDVKFYPREEVAPFPFEGESTSASSSATSEDSDILQYEQQLEESKRWIEMQFQGEQFERAPLEDIKEEEMNEFDSSSKIGSMGSMKESLGSLGSMKGSFSSTPDYDVLAGRKYFSKGDNDDVSMSSLQEFELLEKKILDGRKSGSSGSSQDSLNCRKLGTSNKSTGGDDFSAGSLKDFEALENICVNVTKIEKKVKEDEVMLSEIEEGHESQVSESESCETMPADNPEKESDSEGFDRKMFEIDEIIKQARTNIECFVTESVGRGDSFEEVAKIPDLELDHPQKSKTTYSTQVVTKKQVQKWREEGDLLSSDSPDSLDIKQKVSSISTDSIEMDTKRNIMTDSIEQGDTISIDSFDMKLDKKGADTFSVDSFERGRPLSDVVSDSLEALHRSDSLEFGDDEAGAICRDPPRRPPPRSDFLLGSSDSLDPSSSTATHATYHYESDSVMSSSFTSGGSNTLVSDGEPSTEAWFENLATGGEPFVSEVIERLEDDEYSHTIHRTVETAPDVRKVVFTGPNAEQALKEYIEGFGPGEDVIESEEIDEHGNVHVKKVIQRRIVVRPDDLDEKDMTPEQLQAYFKQFETKTYGDTFSQPPTGSANIGKPAGRLPIILFFLRRG